ncbi:MAG: hypothetical protein NC308_04965, partial [Clostridium sp.]|nr:hypothetical protein [Clostridium sp.]
EMKLFSATGAEYNAMVANKAEAYKTIELAEKITDAGIASGALWSAGTFAAHWYADFTKDKAYSVRFDILEDGVLSHQTVAASLSLDGTLSLSSAVTVDSKAVSSIVFDVDSKSVSAGNSFTAAVSNSGAWYIGSDYRTYVFRSQSDDSRCKACDAIANEFDAQKSLYSSIELSDRTYRPFFTIPSNWDDGRGYVAIYSNIAPYVDENEKDRVYFAGGSRQEMPFGGDSKWISWTLENYPVLVGTYYNDEGIVVVRDGENLIYFLSPVDGNWFVAAK